MKKNTKPTECKLSKELKQALKQYLEYHPATRVNRNLRMVFMTFIQHSLDAIPLNMDDIIWDLSELMELLDLAEDKTSHWPKV